MSWGERSCVKCVAPAGHCENDTCNVDCKWYVWDQKTKPDSVKSGKGFTNTLRKVLFKKKPYVHNPNLGFCARCIAMKTKSHIKKCKKKGKKPWKKQKNFIGCLLL